MRGMGTAEEVSARRGKVVLCFSAAFAAYSVLACRAVAARAGIGADAAGPSSGLLTIVTWALWALAVALWIFGTPGRMKWSAEDRAVLNDDLVRHQRTQAIRVAFVVLVVAGIAQVLGLWGWQLPSWWSIASLSAAIAAAGIVFGVLDVKANG